MYSCSKCKIVKKNILYDLQILEWISLMRKMKKTKLFDVIRMNELLVFSITDFLTNLCINKLMYRVLHFLPGYLFMLQFMYFFFVSSFISHQLFFFWCWKHVVVSYLFSHIVNAVIPMGKTWLTPNVLFFMFQKKLRISSWRCTVDTYALRILVKFKSYFDIVFSALLFIV